MRKLKNVKFYEIGSNRTTYNRVVPGSIFNIRLYELFILYGKTPGFDPLTKKL